jgi:hypothetical protein
MPVIFMLSLNEFVDYSNNALSQTYNATAPFVSRVYHSPGSSTGI